MKHIQQRKKKDMHKPRQSGRVNHEITKKQQRTQSNIVRKKKEMVREREIAVAEKKRRHEERRGFSVLWSFQTQLCVMTMMTRRQRQRKRRRKKKNDDPFSFNSKASDKTYHWPKQNETTRRYSAIVCTISKMCKGYQERIKGRMEQNKLPRENKTNQGCIVTESSHV